MSQLCCPDHGNLMRELALGRLGDADGVRAEELRRLCPGCRRWWDGHLGESTVGALDAAVAAAFSEFAPAGRRRRLVWPAATAAAALVAAIGSALLLGHRGSAPEMASQPAEGPRAVVSVWDFEGGVLGAATASAETAAVSRAEAAGDSSVMAADFESGDLSTWSFHG